MAETLKYMTQATRTASENKTLQLSDVQCDTCQSRLN